MIHMQLSCSFVEDRILYSLTQSFKSLCKLAVRMYDVDSTVHRYTTYLVAHL